MPLIIEHRALSSMTVMYIVGLIRAWKRAWVFADLTWQGYRFGNYVFPMLFSFRLGHLSQWCSFHLIGRK